MTDNPAKARARFHSDPTSIERPAHLGGAGEPRPIDIRNMEHVRSDRMRRTIVIARTLCPELWFGASCGYRIRQRRVIRGVHALLMAHHGLASKLLIYQHLPKYLPERKQPLSYTPRTFWNPPFRTLDQRYSSRLNDAISEGKKTGIFEVVKLPEDTVTMVPPGRACVTCRMWLSPGDVEMQRCQEPCEGPPSAESMAADGGGGSSIQK